MNKIFDFKRFGKYFCFDLVSAWQRSGVTLLAIACLPVWIFAIHQLFGLIFGGQFGSFGIGGIAAAYISSFFFAVIAFPVQNYGHLTDKKAGSDWLMLPVSRLEKFASVLLITCVVVPLVWFAVIVACDGLLSLLFNTYPAMGLPKMMDGLGSVLAEFHSENVSFAVGGPWAIYLSWCADILVFTLGAMYFRKHKVVYTFLSLFALGLLMTMALGILFNGNMHISPEDINEDSLMHTLNAVVYTLYVVEFVVLDLAIFFRIKTLKH